MKLTSYRQYVNCRGDGGYASPHRDWASPHRDLGVPPSRFRRPPIEIWALVDERKKNLQNPVEYTTKSHGNSDSEEKTLQVSAKTFFLHLISGEKTFQFLAKTFFFFGLHLISMAKKTHQFLDSRRRLLSFLVFIQFRRRRYVIFTKV